MCDIQFYILLIFMILLNGYSKMKLKTIVITHLDLDYSELAVYLTLSHSHARTHTHTQNICFHWLYGRAHSEPGGTWWRTGGEVKRKLANGVGSQYSQATSEHGISIITKADAYTSAANSWLNWRPHRFKWTRPFWGKTNSGFCACAITFRTSFTPYLGFVLFVLKSQLVC